MDYLSSVIYILAGITIGSFLYSLFSQHSLRSIPTVGGPSAPVLSYLGALRYWRHGREILHEGYTKYKGSPFKMAMLDRWIVVISGKRLVDELLRFRDDCISLPEGSGELTSSKYMFKPHVVEDPYHMGVIRHLMQLFDDMHDEIGAACDEYIPATSTEWLAVPSTASMRTLVTRVTARVFVGLPLCRNAEYIKLSVDYTMAIGKARPFVSRFPPFLKPSAHAQFYILSAVCVVVRAIRVPPSIQAALRVVGPTISERWQALDEYGDERTEKPRDALQWIIEEARARNDGIEDIVHRLFNLNFAAIFTSYMSFTFALHHVAASSELLKILREEVELVTEKYGWSKDSVDKMYKLDSFMRESQRFNGIHTATVMRKALKEVEFSNGVIIPAGTIMVVPSLSTHVDEENHDNGHIFDPFRHLDLDESKEGTEGSKRRFASATHDYVAFGLGRHACTGRFFASMELKTIMAHLILNYDIKLEPEGVLPPNLYIGFGVIPNPTTKVFFKRRHPTKS